MLTAPLHICHVTLKISWLGYTFYIRPDLESPNGLDINVVYYKIIIIIIINGIYIAQVRKGHKCAMSAEMAVWLRICRCLYSYLHN